MVVGAIVQNTWLVNQISFFAMVLLQEQHIIYNMGFILILNIIGNIQNIFVHFETRLDIQCLAYIVVDIVLRKEGFVTKL